jgi:hypothetical protein
MTSTTTTPSFALVPSLETAWQDVDRSFERFCLTAGPWMPRIQQLPKFGIVGVLKPYNTIRPH